MGSGFPASGGPTALEAAARSCPGNGPVARLKGMIEDQHHYLRRSLSVLKPDSLLEVEILFVSPKFYLESPGPAILMSEVPVGIRGSVDVNDGPWIFITGLP